MCLELTLKSTNNYFHVRLSVGLFNTCRINLTSLESSSGWQLMWTRNTSTIAFCIWGKMKYLGKDEVSWDTPVSRPSYVVTKLMQPIFKRGYNVTCDNFFTSLDVALRLTEQKCSIVGTVRQNRKELPQAAKR